MRALYLPAALLGVLVLVLLGSVWPITRRSVGGYRTEALRETEAVARAIEGMQTSAGLDLGRAKALAQAVKALHRPFLGTIEVDPFAWRRREEPPVTGGQESDDDGQASRQQGTGTQETETENEMGPDLTLHGIVLAENGSMAVINSEVLALGSIVEGLLVAEIAEQEVVLVSPEGERHVLVLKGWDLREENP